MVWSDLIKTCDSSKPRPIFCSWMGITVSSGSFTTDKWIITALWITLNLFTIVLLSTMCATNYVASGIVVVVVEDHWLEARAVGDDNRSWNQLIFLHMIDDGLKFGARITRLICRCTKWGAKNVWQNYGNEWKHKWDIVVRNSLQLFSYDLPNCVQVFQSELLVFARIFN